MKRKRTANFFTSKFLRPLIFRRFQFSSPPELFSHSSPKPKNEIKVGSEKNGLGQDQVFFHPFALQGKTGHVHLNFFSSSQVPPCMRNLSLCVCVGVCGCVWVGERERGLRWLRNVSFLANVFLRRYRNSFFSLSPLSHKKILSNPKSETIQFQFIYFYFFIF